MSPAPTDPTSGGAIPRGLRVRRWVTLTLCLVFATLLAWPIVSLFDFGPFAPTRPGLDGAATLPAGGTVIAPVGAKDAPAHVTAVMPAGWYVENDKGEYGDRYATITVTAFPLAGGFTATDDASREHVADVDARAGNWRLGPVERHTYSGHPVVAVAVSDDPVEWRGVTAYLFLDATVVRFSCAYVDEDQRERAMDGCVTAMANVAVVS